MLKVHWKVDRVDPGMSQSAGDVLPTWGSIVLEDGASTGQITLSIIADDLSELSEQFLVKLVSVDGGADIDTDDQTSSFTIRHVWSLILILLISIIFLRLFLPSENAAW